MVRGFPLNWTLSQANKAKMKEVTLMITTPPNPTSGMGSKIQHLSQLIVMGSQSLVRHSILDQFLYHPRQVRLEHPWIRMLDHTA